MAALLPILLPLDTGEWQGILDGIMNIHFLLHSNPGSSAATGGAHTHAQNMSPQGTEHVCGHDSTVPLWKSHRIGGRVGGTVGASTPHVFSEKAVNIIYRR